MLRIRVIGFQGKPVVDGKWSEFGGKGGTLGRAPENTICLPDPERHVSRIHATVTFEMGEYVITDQGTALPVHVNGQPLGQGNRVRLVNGDELAIGDYRLEVAVEARAAEAAEATGTAAAGGDVFAELVASARKLGAAPSAPPKAPPPQAGANLIPEDFDVFATPPPKPSAPPLPETTGLGLRGEPAPGTAGPSIDELFGLSGTSAESPLPGSPLAEPLGEPLASSGGRIAQPDQVAEISAPFRPPRPRPPEPTIPALETPEPAIPELPVPAPVERPVGEGYYVSWGKQEGTEPPPAARHVVELAPPPPPAPETRPAAPPGLPPQPLAPVPPAPAAPPAGALAAEGEELARAFLEGLGIAQLPLPEGMTPAFMRSVGQLLRESTQGTLDLLLARAMTKREIRADVTLILGKENNPLKFSPTVEVALTHLLTPTGMGFMTPEAAMKDAYADLRAHQFGFMAGMRAALAGVLARFDPETLERRLTEKTMLDNLLPISRRAKLWDLYIQLYGNISQEVEEDFHTLFGKEFLRAYEEQVERLRTKS